MLDTKSIYSYDTLSIFITLNVPNTLREQKFIQNIQLDSQQNDVNIVNISSLRVPLRSSIATLHGPTASAIEDGEGTSFFATWCCLFGAPIVLGREWSRYQAGVPVCKVHV